MDISNIEVLYEDNHLIILNKKATELVQGDKTGDEPLVDKVKKYIKITHKKEGNVFLGVVHRLDRPTSGIVIFAKSSKALPRLNKMFQEHKIHKTYWAITGKNNIPTQGELIDYLRRNEKQNKSYITKDGAKEAKKAHLTYSVIEKIDKYQLLEIKLLTGRHHQIRCQMAHIESPLVGDLKYGYNRSNKDGSICLHARSVEFIHPVSQELISVKAPSPTTGIWKFFKQST